MVEENYNLEDLINEFESFVIANFSEEKIVQKFKESVIPGAFYEFRYFINFEYRKWLVFLFCKNKGIDLNQVLILKGHNGILKQNLNTILLIKTHSININNKSIFDLANEIGSENNFNKIFK